VAVLVGGCGDDDVQPLNMAAPAPPAIARSKARLENAAGPGMAPSSSGRARHHL